MQLAAHAPLHATHVKRAWKVEKIRKRPEEYS